MLLKFKNKIKIKFPLILSSFFIFFFCCIMGCSIDLSTASHHNKSSADKSKILIVAAKSVNCIWPAKGKIVKTFFEGSKDKRGIEIAGYSGQPIIASVRGLVVYSGEGLKNYGNLIIIKYNDNFLTVYGFVRNSLVKEGEFVQQGEKIAEMGGGGRSQKHAVLHFEIRENGKAVDPLLYLKV